jgi:hypothetical protein
MEELIMKTQQNTRRRVSLVMAIILFFGVTAPAQQERQLAQAMQQNARELRQYSWKSRTEVRKDTELKSFQLHLMQYSADGTLQQILVDEMTPKVPTHGLRGLIAKKKKEDFLKTLEGLKAIAKSYGDLSPEKMKEFITNANINIEPNPQPGRIRIQGRDVLQPGDSITIWVDTVARRQRRMEINTTYDNEIVRIVTDFQDIPNGPTYMSRSVIDYPSEGISLTKENFDYQRNQFGPGVTAGGVE